MGGSEYLKRSYARGHLKVLELLRQWDPIGVICEDNQDEYDGYAPKMVGMLDRGCDTATLANHLGQIRIVSMGMPDSEPARQRDIEMARRLVVWWKDWKGS